MPLDSGVNKAICEAVTEADVKVSGKNAVQGILSFDDPRLGLHRKILQNLGQIGFQTPTPIQCHGMPQMMAQVDMMCCSCTGSGKTAAYLLPVINLITKEENKPKSSGGVGGGGGSGPACPRALILTPTRELAEQICKDSKVLSGGLGLHTLAVFGGDSIGRELAALKRRKLDILVATPGRLQHLLSEFQNVLVLKDTKFLVIDEADEMFNRDFFKEIREIVQEYMKPKEERVTAMFSATFPLQIQYYAKKHLRTDFVRIVVGTIGGAAPDIIQEILPASEIEKQMKLYEILEKEVDKKKVLIFANRIDKVDILAEFLRRKKIRVTWIHSDLEQRERDQAVEDFNEGKSRVLVATSVASRGLNFVDVGLVINYDIPDNVEDYVQRIGRARRSDTGQLGMAISFYDERSDSDKRNDLKFALRSGNQTIPEFLEEDGDGGVGGNEPELLAECLDDESLITKMKKFSIRPVYETYEDTDYWG